MRRPRLARASQHPRTRSPVLISTCPPRPAQAMVESCLERDHAKRPTFEGLAATLDALLAEGEAATAAPPPPPAHSMGACQAGGELAAAAAALGSAPAVGTPNPAHS